MITITNINDKQLLTEKNMESIIKKHASEISSETTQEKMLEIITKIVYDAINSIDHKAIANIALSGMSKKMHPFG